jgi:hypothetical protein
MLSSKGTNEGNTFMVDEGKRKHLKIIDGLGRLGCSLKAQYVFNHVLVLITTN